MRVVFRTDSSAEIGSGHVMRCLTLADVLRSHGADVLFVCRELAGHLAGLIQRRGHRVVLLPRTFHPTNDGRGLLAKGDAEETLSALTSAGFNPDWLVVDHYGIAEVWERRLRSKVSRILVIDDMADRPHDCDIILDQNLVANWACRYDGTVPGAARRLLGPRYALLQPEFAVARRCLPERNTPPHRVLVYFGGSDESNVTGRVIMALLEPEFEGLEIDVVAGVQYTHWGELREIAGSRRAVVLYPSQPSLAPLLLQADLAIGASGATSWERLCLKVPALVVTLADNQRAIASELDRLGLVRWLGDVAAVDDGHWRDAITRSLSEVWRPNFSNVPEVDGDGARRVSAEMQ